MSTAPASVSLPIDVIDLVSDDGSIDEVIPAHRPADAAYPREHADGDAGSMPAPLPDLGFALLPDDLLGERPDHATMSPRTGHYVDIDGELVFIPDEPGPSACASKAPAPDCESAVSLREPAVTVDICLQRVLELFPDVSHDHVVRLYHDFDQEGDFETLPGQARLDNIIEQLLSGVFYPKQEKSTKSLKRKRRDSDGEDDGSQRWEGRDRRPLPHFLKGAMQALLKIDFPHIPTSYINDTLAIKHFLYPAYLALAKAEEEDAGKNRLYNRGRPTKNPADAFTIATNIGWPQLTEELEAAQTRVNAVKADRAAREARKLAEQENLEKARASGTIVECSACFDDLPMNRQIYCDGSPAHFTCFDCMRTYIKTEVGESRCRVLCPSGCGAGFSPQQLSLISDDQLIKKLAQLQQEKDIRDAGLEDLEECPFCDYKAILPPIEEDFEFRCANPECEKVSCRRCRCISHVPVSCEQHAKENKLNSRHRVEEAMTAALVRSCNKCKKQFIKDYGCNKMTCPSCGNLQCYVCSATVTDYQHFDQTGTGGQTGPDRNSKCPLSDNVEERHEREVREAEAAARAQVVEENPDITAEDLEIKVSDAVKTSTLKRAGHAGGGGFDEFHDDDHRFVRFRAEHIRQREMQRLFDLRRRRQQVRQNPEQPRPWRLEPQRDNQPPPWPGCVHGPGLGYQPPAWRRDANFCLPPDDLTHAWRGRAGRGAAARRGPQPPTGRLVNGLPDRATATTDIQVPAPHQYLQHVPPNPALLPPPHPYGLGNDPPPFFVAAPNYPNNHPLRPGLFPDYTKTPPFPPPLPLPNDPLRPSAPALGAFDPPPFIPQLPYNNPQMQMQMQIQMQMQPPAFQPEDLVYPHFYQEQQQQQQQQPQPFAGFGDPAPGQAQALNPFFPHRSQRPTDAAAEATVLQRDAPGGGGEADNWVARDWTGVRCRKPEWGDWDAGVDDGSFPRQF